jgi:hypothetical protein
MVQRGQAGPPLWFMDGGRYGRIDARRTSDGGLEILHREMGASDRAVWGEDDHEATLNIAPSDVAAFALALLSQRYAGRADALTALRDLCEDHGVPVAYANWT